MENTELIPVEEKISNGLAVFETKKQQLSELAMTSKGLVVTDITDKKQIEAVSNARKELKKERISIEKQAKELRDNVTVISKNISAKEKELISLIEPTEIELAAEEKRVETEKENIRLEAQRKEKERIKARVKQLIECGCTFDGVSYSIADCSINDTQLQVMEDGIFTIFLDRVKIEHERELQMAEQAGKVRIAEALHLENVKKEEEARIKKEREELAEQQRIFAEQQEKVRKEQQEAQDKINAENERIAKEQREKQAELDRQAKEIQDKKDAAERIERERLMSIEADRIAAEKETLRVEAARLAAIDVENKRIADEKAEAEALAAENLRQASLAPDKDKLIALAGSLSEFPIPKMSTPEGSTILDEVVILIQKINGHITKKVKAL